MQFKSFTKRGYRFPDDFRSLVSGDARRNTPIGLDGRHSPGKCVTDGKDDI
jgi:hypothetical protein